MLSFILYRAVLAVILLAVALFVGTIAHYTIASRRPKAFPPGPPTWPVIGNAHLLPPEKAFLKFREWRQQYGDIYGMKLGPTNVVVLGSQKHVQELFEKRGTIYSSRPYNHIWDNIICTEGDHILFLPYGNTWRKQRKAMNSILNINAVSRILPIQDAESSQLLFDILKRPADTYNHLRRYASAVILAAVYGQRGAAYDSPVVQTTFRVQDQVTATLAPGATPPVDAFTFLQSLPDWLAAWRPRARALHEAHHGFYFSLFDKSKERWLKGGIDSMIARLISEQEKSDMSDANIVHTGSPILEAGSETSSSTLQSFLLIMATHPHVLKKMQTELDEICGVTRLPRPDDIDRLPYVQAVVQEVLRWRPATANGIPHEVSEDDHYEGYFIPQGTMIFANTWAIHSSDSEYAHALQFKPERFLDSTLGLRGSANDDDGPRSRRVTLAFGAGRRACPGERLALNSLMLGTAKIAWAFDIAEDPSSPVDLSWETGYRDGLSQGPKPFKVLLHVRSAQHEQRIAGAFKEADEFLKRYED